jgi:serine/threonine protein kinase
VQRHEITETSGRSSFASTFNEEPSSPHSLISRKFSNQEFGPSENDDHDPSEVVNFSSFTVIEELGVGSFAKVYKVFKNDTQDVYAMKLLNKKFLMKQKQLKYAISECRVLKTLEHPFIINLEYAFQTPKNLYLVLEYCPNGDLS